jgi:phenylalanyl-tRNA synthetase beta chain
MKIPLSWLRDFVDITLSPEALAQRLTLAGMEVEGITRIGELWDRDKVFVGQVLSVTRHPEADRLTLVRVNYGAPEPLTVVTGAPNMYPFLGQDLSDGRGPKVAFAVAGARLVDGHSEERRVVKLKTSKIRGIESQGMVCSEKELDLSDQHEGNLMLPADAPIGMPLVDYMGDAILEFDIKGAFGHLQSVVGIARETAALTEQPLRRTALTALDRYPAEIVQDTDFARIVIEAPDLCPRYSAALIEGLKIGPSPLWMQQRLIRAGMRPISNIVDVTNYVMLEMGQPLHAFDYDLLRARAERASTGSGTGRPTIIMRRAHPGEHLTTLDGVDRALDPGMLMITDTAGTIAVGGIMGGADTEVNDNTTCILLEAANFNFLSIRRSSQLLKLSSEAGSRFGKGVDPELTVKALARAGELLAEVAGGTTRPVYADAYPGKQPPKVVELEPIYADRLLGIAVPVPEIVRILRDLEFTVEPQKGRADGKDGLLRVIVPSHRLDVNIPADLVEEIGRIYGYDRLPMTLLRDELPEQRRNVSLEGEEAARDIMVGCGLDEVITYSMVDISDDTRLRADKRPVDPSAYVPIRNPLTAERAHMRRSLLAGLANMTRANLRFRNRVAIYEIGRVYMWAGENQLPDQPRRLTALLIGPREPQTWLPHAAGPLDFFDLKGIAEALLGRLGLTQDVTWERSDDPALHPGRAARILVKGSPAGIVGELHPVVRAAFDLPDEPVVVMELDLEALLANWGAARPMTDVSGQPAVYEDLAVIVEEAVAAERVAAVIRQTGGKLLVDLQLFDVYRGQPIPAGSKSLAYALTFQAPDRTLTDEDVRKLRTKITNRLGSEVGATLRS